VDQALAVNPDEWREELPLIEEWFEFVCEKLSTGIKDRSGYSSDALLTVSGGNLTTSAELPRLTRRPLPLGKLFLPREEENSSSHGDVVEHREIHTIW
jgi:hypothetical protein